MVLSIQLRFKSHGDGAFSVMLPSMSYYTVVEEVLRPFTLLTILQFETTVTGTNTAFKNVSLFILSYPCSLVYCLPCPNILLHCFLNNLLVSLLYYF